jgi:hypothetical protein
MKDDSDPSFSQELHDLPGWDRSFWLSRAFVEASSCLCSSMLQGDFSSQYSSSRVILHLARQGIELFLKAALEAAGERTERFGHNLDQLFFEYRRHYPNLSFYFQAPKRFEVDLTLDLFPDTIEPIQATLDQRHRYAADRKGNNFASPEIFDPKVVHEELEELRRTLQILEWSTIRPLLQAENAP